MIRRSIFAIACAFASVAPCWAQPLSEAAIEAAIKAGAAKQSLAVRAVGWDFYIEIAGPAARIATAAHTAANEFRSFTRSDVTAEMLSENIVFTVEPGAPRRLRNELHVTPPATHVALVPKTKKGQPPATGAQPLTKEYFDKSWSNEAGGQFSGRGIVATFAPDAIPDGDFDIMVACDGCKEPRRAPVKSKQRALIQ